MLIFRYFVILFSITLFINAQASKLIINVPNRSGISLNGEWDYIRWEFFLQTVVIKSGL